MIYGWFLKDKQRIDAAIISAMPGMYQVEAVRDYRERYWVRAVEFHPIGSMLIPVAA